MALVKLEDATKKKTVQTNPIVSLKLQEGIYGTNPYAQKTSPTPTTTSTTNATPAQTLAYQQYQAQYSLQKTQAQEAYDLAMNQLSQQQLEQKASATKLGQQAYLSKMKSQKVSPDVLAKMGTSNTGYENVYRNKQADVYNKNYESIQSDYQNALNAIQRSRESEQLSYNQKMAGINLNELQSQQDYNLQNAPTVTTKSTVSSKYDTVRNVVMTMGSSQSVTDRLNSAIANGEVTLAEAQKIKDDWSSSRG